MNELTLTLIGQEEKIRGLPLNDISAILEDLDRLLIAQAGEAAQGDVDLHPRLTAAHPGSLVLVCELPTNYPLESLRHLQQTLTKHDNHLVPKAYEALTRIVRRLKTRNLRASLRISSDPTLAIDLAPDTEIPAPLTVIERTTIYGVLTRVGGSDPPRATLQLPNGKTLTVRLTRTNAQGIPMAQQLARRLYKIVGLKGEARIRLADHTIEHMRADEIVSYNPAQNIEELLAALQRIGQDLPPISQIDQFYADIYG